MTREDVSRAFTIANRPSVKEGFKKPQEEEEKEVIVWKEGDQCEVGV